ncbi:MAG: putative Ig domain-containing protein, partial [Verrucomicrobiota bacterium]
MALPWALIAQVATSEKEAFTREFSVFVGLENNPPIQEVASREFSIVVAPGRDDAEAISREFSVLVDVAGAPPALSSVTVTPSATGDRLDLAWGDYQPIRIGDIQRFDIYVGTVPLTSLSGKTPTLTVGGDSTSARIEGLAPFRDYFVTVVPVDGQGNRDEAIRSFGAYVVAREVVSREYSMFQGDEPSPPYRDLVSREFSVLMSNPEPPPAISGLKATPSPTGESIQLSWAGYNLRAVGDVAYFDVFMATTPFTNVAGMTPVLRAHGEALEATLSGLQPGQDRYLAVVPVDGQGNRNPAVAYAGAYRLHGEVFTREYSVFNGNEPPSPPPAGDAVALINGDFEGVGTGEYIYLNGLNREQRKAFGWMSGGNGGSGPALFRSGNGTWGYAAVPSGTLGLSLQGDGYVQQSVVLPEAGTYLLTWQATSRRGQVNPYQVELIPDIVDGKPRQFLIEAEDYDHGGGKTVPAASVMPYPGGAYAGSSGIEGVDYSRPNGNPEPNITEPYREKPPKVPMWRDAAGELPHGIFEVTQSYMLGWNSGGNWQNYTRTIPKSRYRAYAGLSSGNGGTMAWNLSRVTSGQGTASQGLEVLGTFDAPATGGWGAISAVGLRASGTNVLLDLDGNTTLRATFAQTSDIDFILLESTDADRATKVLGPFSTSDTGWKGVSAFFDVTQPGRYTLTFRGLNPSGGDDSVAVDAVGLQRYLGEGVRPVPGVRELVSRETSIVVATPEVPDVVTGDDGLLSVKPSVVRPRALDLDWSGYKELANRDVVRYRVYLARSFFANVSTMTPVAHALGEGRQFTLDGLDADTSYHVAVVAEDALGQFNPNVRSVSATTLPRLQVTIPNLAVTEGQTLDHQIVSNEGNLSVYQFSFSVASAPSGLEISPGGRLVWTPDERHGPGDYPVLARVTDNGVPGVSTTNAFVIQVSGGNLRPRIGTIFFREVAEQTLLSFALSATDRETPTQLTWRLVSGPSGVTVSTNGVLAWTPAEEQGPGDYPTTVRVTDGGGAWSEATFTLRANEANRAPTLQVAGATTVAAGLPVTLQAVGTDPDVPAQSLQYFLVSGPTNAVVNPTSGAVTWYADRKGSVTFRLGVSDGTLSATNSVELQVTPSPSLPVEVARGVGTGLDPGMTWRTHQLASARDNRLSLLEDQLKGLLGPSVHDPTGETNGVFRIDAVNFEQSGGAAGMFRTGAAGALGVADRLIPGIPGQGGSTDNIAGEALAYLEFPAAGIYTMGVSSDDGFRVSVGSETNRAMLVLGEFDGGRGTGETVFAFEVTQPGLYPFRLTWMEGSGGADVEWYSIRPDGTRLLVNGAQADALRAYRGRTGNTPPYFTNLGDVTIPEMVQYSLTLRGADADVPAQTLTYRWVSGPSGSGVTNGVLSWLPSETQGPSTNLFRVAVSDGVASVTNGFNLFVTEVNRAPTLAFTGSTNVLGGQVLAMTAVGTDADRPTNTLRYFLVSGPSGLSLDPVMGGIRWLATGTGLRPVSVGVTDGTANTTNRFQANVLAAPLPDLVAWNVTAPSNAPAGRPLTLSYAVTNQGTLTTTNGWVASIRLIAGTNSSAAAITAAPVLGSLVVTNVLGPGQVLVFTNTLAVPGQGPFGDSRLAVVLDANGDIPETNDDNNAAVAPNLTRIAAALNIEVSVARIPGDGSVASRLVVQRNGDRTVPLSVVLTLSDTTELAFRGAAAGLASTNVLIPQGEGTVAIDVVGVRDGILDGTQVVAVTASAVGYVPGAATLEVSEVDVPRLTLEAGTNSVVEGRTIPFRVTRDGPLSAPLTVTLASSNPGQLSPPAVVTLPAGSNAWAFAVLAVDDVNAEPSQSHTITASADGFDGGQATITVEDNDVPSIVVSLSAGSVGEGAGSQAVSMTVTRDPVGSGALAIEPFASDPNLVVTPLQISIPAGQASRSFPIGVLNDALVNGDRVVTLGAYVLAAGTGQRLGTARPATLTVRDDDGPTLSLVAAQRLVPEGRNPATLLTISRNTPTTNSIVVVLSSSLTNEARVQATVTLPSGKSSMDVPLITVADGVADGSKSVVLTASATGFAPGVETIVVSDTDLPDMVVQAIDAPTNAVPQQRVSVTYRIANMGLSAAPAGTLTRLYLSRDNVVGDDVLAAQFRTPAALAVGEQLVRTESIDLPVAAGDYWLVVETDAEQSMAEVLEDNNVAIAPRPIAVRTDYGAWVATDVTRAAAGSGVALYGKTTNNAGVAVGLKPALIRARVRGTERVFSVTSDAAGNFTYLFKTLPGEAGRYEILATHPGAAAGAVQDTFELMGFRVDPEVANVGTVEATSTPGSITIENLGDVGLTGIAANVVSVPAGMAVAFDSVPSSLPGLQRATVTYRLQPTNAAAAGAVVLRIASSEGAWREVRLNVQVEPLRPRLVALPASLEAGMVVGEQELLEFDVVNVGGRESGPVQVLLPGVPWMALTSTNVLPGIPVGGTNRIGIVLTPARNLPLGPYTGTLALNASNASATVPFTFRAISTAVGDLVVDAVNEFTYYVEGAPHLAGANVVVRDAVTRTNVATGVTDTNGLFVVRGIAENHYEVEVTAEKHTTYRATHLLRPGITNRVQAFLSRQTVTYSWNVEPVQFEDRYRITIDTTFETVVPAPVVTIEPALIDLATIQGDDAVIDLKITNHGLIAAEQGKLRFGTHPRWLVTPLTSDIGMIPAKSSVTVPVRLSRLGGAGFRRAALSGTSGDVSGEPCTISASLDWSLVCGPDRRWYQVPILIINASGDCLAAVPEFPGLRTMSSGESSPSGPVITIPVMGTSQRCLTCDPKTFRKKCDGMEASIDVWGIKSSVLDAINKSMPPFFRLMDAGVELSGGGELCDCCLDGKLGRSGAVFAGIDAKAEVGFGYFLPDDLLNLKIGQQGDFSDVSVRLEAFAGVKVDVGGEGEVKLNWECFETIPELCVSFQLGAELGPTIEVSGVARGVIDGAVYEGSIQGTVKVTTTIKASIEGCGEFESKACWDDVKAEVSLAGSIEVPGKGSRSLTFSRTIDLLKGNCDGVAQGGGAVASTSHPMGRLRQAAPAASDPAPPFRVSIPQAAFLGPLGVFDGRSVAEVMDPSSPANQDGVCARVKVRLEQDAVIARDGFRAVLELENNGATRLENVRVQVEAKDESGVVSTGLFDVRLEGTMVMSAVDGTGILPGNSKGTARWLLIPTVDAAPQVATRYLVGGKLSYRLDGVDVAVDMTPVVITVMPSPRLTLQYFHQRDVLADDPFTTQVEPSVPYGLAVLVQNKGYGAARNFRITSAQPKVVENEKGLLIDFNIAGTEVFGSDGYRSLNPSLTASLGDIPAGGGAIGRWLMLSSLQGLFIDYSARFEHIDGLGNARLSLIDDVSIHEMIRVVRAGGVWDDGKPDFLVNDEPDLRDLPDTLYQSNGTTNRVQVVESATISGAVTPSSREVTVTARMPGGWGYLRVPDPANGQLQLADVRRSDGTSLGVGTNAWTTDRTFRGMAQRPLMENILHLVDFNSDGRYVLTYVAPTNSVTETMAPESAVAALPSQSRAYFQVTWSGRDSAPLGQPVAGIGYYDVYVSEDGGAFAPWLQKTTLVGATYTGRMGSRYGFFSIATDANGNREGAPATADATTTVGVTNNPPSLALAPGATLVEGDSLDVGYDVNDPDLGQSVVVRIVSGPAGLTLDATRRRLAWSTSELQGPSTNTVVIEAIDSDGGTRTASMVIVVQESNQPPAFGTLAATSLPARAAFGMSLGLWDPDIPAQPLTARLVSGPAGLVVTNGAIAWTPASGQAKTTNLVVVAASDGVATVTNSLVLMVTEAASAPTLAGATNSVISELSPYTQALVPQGGSPAAGGLTVALVSGPTGLVVTNGVLAWTPTEAQGPSTNTVVVSVNDGVVGTTNSFTLVVTEVNRAPAFAGATNGTLPEMVGFTRALGANDPDVPTQALAVKLEQGPTGMALTNGVLAWTPTEAQGSSTNTVVVSVTDGVTGTTNSFTLVVTEVNRAPAFAGATNGTLPEMVGFTRALGANDPDVPTQALAVKLEQGPTGMA